MLRPVHSYAFVLPRFGESIVGGAETLVGAVAARLAARGDHIEIFTTCAKDNRTWQNDFPPGEAVEFGLPVTRFPVDERDLDLWVRHQLRLNDGIPLTVDEQLEWMGNSVSSQALYEHLLKNAARFDAFFFAPYLFGTTFWGSLVCPEKSFLIPCLHDEQNAYVDVIGSMFRQVRGAVFNAVPEGELACRLYGNIQGGAVGMGFEPYAQTEVDALTPYFKEGFPYVLYLGRKETGKNAHILIDYFIKSKEQDPALADVKLVIAGGGSFSDLLRPAAAHRPDIIDLHHVSEEEKRRLIKHSLLLCQPSKNESFSIVLMEAWLLGSPVLVHAGCPVTKHHAVESGGGLFFGSQTDFGAVVGELLRKPGLRAQLGQAGLVYVKEKYNWDAVLERFDRVMERFSSRKEAPADRI